VDKDQDQEDPPEVEAEAEADGVADAALPIHAGRAVPAPVRRATTRMAFIPRPWITAIAPL
jgi:hypothetical protein